MDVSYTLLPSCKQEDDSMGSANVQRTMTASSRAHLVLPGIADNLSVDQDKGALGHFLVNDGIDLGAEATDLYRDIDSSEKSNCAKIAPLQLLAHLEVGAVDVAFAVLRDTIFRVGDEKVADSPLGTILVLEAANLRVGKDLCIGKEQGERRFRDRRPRSFPEVSGAHPRSSGRD